MQLRSVQVRMFRNIVDSGVVAIEPDVTCLVGKNESGKTALLSAIYLANPAHGTETFDVLAHYPRWRLSSDRRSGAVDDSEPIECVYELDDDDVRAVEDILGPDVLQDRRFAISRRYAGTASVRLSVDKLAACADFFRAAESPTSLREIFVGINEPAEVAKKAESLEVPEDGVFTAEHLVALKEVAEARVGTTSIWQAAVAILRRRQPKFFYFSDYQTLPGRIDVRELGGEDLPGATRLQTARALLDLAGTTAAALTDEDFEERKAELEAVSNELTAEVFEYWTQNTELSVEIDMDKVTEQTNFGQHAVARFLEVRVKDRRHGFTNNFGDRSSGFQWFFSFLAAFSQFKKSEHGIVVLLDEPALTLHGRAQADFLRFINERLAPAAQVIFTTHSPFMVDVSRLDRVRIVEDLGPTEGSVVTEEVFAVGDDSLFPLEAALGYDIAQSLFIGAHNLLVEGTSDFTYLTLLSDYLKSLGRSHLDDRWRVLPAGGATNIPTFVALIGRALPVTVVIDSSSPSGTAKLQRLDERGLLSRKRLLLTDSFTENISPSDIEDLFSPGDYLTLYNAAFGTNIKVSDLNGTDRVIARISRHLDASFDDHGKPADALLRSRDKMLPNMSETTLTRFERLIKAINSTLS
jgi:AAA domain, putative AbiEii toxin, Type IV TA system